MSWATVQSAIQNAVVLASGIAGDHVIWKWPQRTVGGVVQDSNAPALDAAHPAYLALAVTAPVGVGLDGIKKSVDLTRPAGQEVKRQVIALRQVMLQIDVYTLATSSNGSSIGAGELAEIIRTSFSLSTVMDALAAAEVSTFDLSRAAQVVPSVVAAGFRGRAVLELGCYMPGPAVAEFLGYIATSTTPIAVGGSTPDPFTNTITLP